MNEPHIQLDEKGVYLIFPIDSSQPNPVARVFTPKTNVNITPPEYTQSGKVGIEIFRVQSPELSFSLFKRECFLPDLDKLNVRKANVILGEQTKIFFPKK